jgi:hypothetical protein
VVTIIRLLTTTPNSLQGNALSGDVPDFTQFAADMLCVIADEDFPGNCAINVTASPACYPTTFYGVCQCDLSAAVCAPATTTGKPLSLPSTSASMTSVTPTMTTTLLTATTNNSSSSTPPTGQW